MKYAVPKILIVLLLFIPITAHSQSNKGTVAFDAPNMPSSEFQFDLDRRVITLVMEDPNSRLAPLFSVLDNLNLRNYRSKSVDLKGLVQYYNETLKKRGWHALGQHAENDTEQHNLHLYTLEKDGTVNGIFVIVKSEGDVYLINIVGEIPKKQLGELLLNLDQLGIEIPELMAIKPRDLELVKSAPEPSPTIHTDAESPLSEKAPPSLAEVPKPIETALKWHFDGKPIHELRIQSRLIMIEDSASESSPEALEAENANIMKMLEGGSGDITQVMPVLAKVLLNSSRKVSLRLEEAGDKHIAVITVEDLPKMQTISVLKSLTISGARGNKIHRSMTDSLIPPGMDLQLLSTRFLAAEAPIHEIRIRGNQKVSEARIRQTLENGSTDLEQALKTLFRVIPHFDEINLRVDEEEQRYIATITVDEKPLSTDLYLGLNPRLRLGFTRVTGWEIGTGFEVGKRKNIGPLWMWNVGSSERDQTSKLFGKVSYAFGNPHFHYRLGGTANWGKTYTWNLGLTAQVHRLTDSVAPEHFLDHDNGYSILQRIIGIPDLQNYYLRQGAAVALEWAPAMPTHWFKLAMLAESHASLEKSTDWFVTNWTSKLKVRGNSPITPGRMRGVIFQYDFYDRTNSLGWYNTLLVEHSSPSVGSDFDFTRLQLHLRYAFPLENNQIRTRFLIGFSNASLPIQRQFVIGGMGGLRGYPWYRQENESDGIITYKSGHRSSPYAFTGDRGFLLNVEYHYRLSNLFGWGIFKRMFLIPFLDEGQVWHVSDGAYTFDPKGNIGIGLQYGRDNAVSIVNIRGLQSGRDNFNLIRVNIAKALESGRGIQITMAWYNSF